MIRTSGFTLIIRAAQLQQWQVSLQEKQVWALKNRGFMKMNIQLFKGFQTFETHECLRTELATLSDPNQLDGLFVLCLVIKTDSKARNPFEDSFNFVRTCIKSCYLYLGGWHPCDSIAPSPFPHAHCADLPK